MKQNNFTKQTHFIGVLLPEDITLTLEDCRRYMREVDHEKYPDVKQKARFELVEEV